MFFFLPDDLPDVAQHMVINTEWKENGSCGNESQGKQGIGLLPTV